MFALHLLRAPVRDLAAARGFWTALLGRPPLTDAPRGEGARTHVDGLDIALVPSPPGDRGPGAVLDLELSHDDLARLRARLPEAAEAAIHATDDGDKRLEARDPSGNLVRIAWRVPER